MERDVGKINDKLRECQAEWFNKICKPWIAKGAKEKNPSYRKDYFTKITGKDEVGFSEPFFTAVGDFKNKEFPLIMFVGQETNGWGNYDTYFKNARADADLDNLITQSQDFVCEFTKNNVIDKNNNLKIKYHDKDCNGYDSHAFWNFIRAVYEKVKINVVWNELDKIHYTCNDPDYKCVTLWEDDEEDLNKNLTNKKSLLLNEIEIIQPDMIIFLTGPSYKASMDSALGKGLTKPKLKSPILNFNIVTENKAKIPCIWTYHPNALCYRGLWDTVLKKIAENINNIRNKGE